MTTPLCVPCMNICDQASPGSGCLWQVLVGRNNKQNDELTNRVAKAGDVWMHARGFPGAHVLLRASAANRFDLVLCADSLLPTGTTATSSVSSYIFQHRVPLDATVMSC